MEIQDYTDSEFKLALERNLRSLTRGKKSNKQPIAILLGGQSGASKTTIHRIKQKEFQGNIVIIDGDSFHSQHPHYLELQQEYGKDSVEYTKDFAGKMVESLVTELSYLGYNLLIEGTLRTIDVPKETAQLLKSKGYEVQLALIATKPKLSYLSTLIRYEELYAINPNQARATPKEHHDLVVGLLPKNADTVFLSDKANVFKVYSREGLIFDSRIHQGQMPSAAIDHELHRNTRRLKSLEADMEQRSHLLSDFQKQVVAGAEKLIANLPPADQIQAKINLYSSQLQSLDKHPEQDADIEIDR